jgi:hypothetical protein
MTTVHRSLLLVICLFVGVTLVASLLFFLGFRGRLSRPLTLEESSAALPAKSAAAPPPLATDAPLPSAPADHEVTAAVGPVELRTWNPVTVTGIESGTNLYFVAKNTGKTAVTLIVPEPGEPQAFEIPETLSIKHFFGFQGRDVLIAPGGEATVEYLIAPDRDGQGEIPFQFSLKEMIETVTIPISISVSAEVPDDLVATSVVTGTVTDSDGQPVAGADVRLHSFSGRVTVRQTSDRAGQFTITSPALADLRAVLGKRRLPYRDLDYFLTIETASGGFAYRGGLSPERGETLTADVQLTEPRAVSYKERGSLATAGAYGYWWLLPNHDFTQLIATQGRHTPLKEAQPGHLVSLDRSGRKLWEVATPTSCWGLAVTDEGEAVAGCTGTNGLIQRVSNEGQLLWSIEGSGESRWAAFSPDGQSILTGPVTVHPGPNGRADAALLAAATGKILWSYAGADEWLRQVRFSRDGERIVAGFSGGRLVMFDKIGREIWQQRTGEFPLVLEIDDSYNVYASGKNRELASFDKDGRLRWRNRIPEHVVTAGANNMSRDGQLIVVGTVGGWLHAFQADGSVAWKRQLPPLAQGHNALDMTPDGQLILVGTNGEQGGYTVIYQADGTLLWKTQFTDSRPATIDRGDHNDTGVITTAISDDGRWLAGGTGDSTIRIFELE